MHEKAPVETATLRDCPIAPAAASLVAIHALVMPAAQLQPPLPELPMVRVLDSDEQRRWNAMHRPDDRDRFLGSRALVKAVVAAQRGCHPRGVRVTALSGRRPQVVGFEASRVSISHTRGLVLVACCMQGDIGIDCEYIDHSLDTAALARRFFGPPEHQTLSQLDDAQPNDGFFRLWTGKEALAKASGAGLDAVLSANLHDLLAKPHQAHHGPWMVRSLPPIAHCAMAVAAAGSAWQHEVHCWDAPALVEAWSG